jgi:hypothetical protein
MKKREEIFNLISVVKVFDINYISDENCNKISGLDGNKPEDISKAIELLAVPEFSTLLLSERSSLIELLKKCLKDEKEKFYKLFTEIEMAFDNEVENKRNFMAILLKVLEPYASETHASID